MFNSYFIFKKISYFSFKLGQFDVSRVTNFFILFFREKFD